MNILLPSHQIQTALCTLAGITYFHIIPMRLMMQSSPFYGWKAEAYLETPNNSPAVLFRLIKNEVSA